MRNIIVAIVAAIGISTLGIAQYQSGVVARSYVSPTDAAAALDGLDAEQVSRASIIPVRVPAQPFGLGLPDALTYIVALHPHVMDSDASCAASSATNSLLPPVTFPSGSCAASLTTWTVSDFPTMAEARTAYEQLGPRQQSTAILISTVATNRPYVLIYQAIGFYCQ